MLLQTNYLKMQCEALDDQEQDCYGRKLLAGLIVTNCDTLVLYNQNLSTVTDIRDKALRHQEEIDRQIESFERLKKYFETSESDLETVSLLVSNFLRSYGASKEAKDVLEKFIVWIIDVGEMTKRNLNGLSISELANTYTKWFNIYNQWNRYDELNNFIPLIIKAI